MARAPYFLLALASFGDCMQGLKHVHEKKGANRMAVLMAGTSDRALIKPLVHNLINANTRQGTSVDYFFSLRPPMMNVKKEYAADRNESKWLRSETTDRYRMDPKVAHFLSKQLATQRADETADDSVRLEATRKLMDAFCQFARKFGADNCEWQLEGDDPLNLPEDEAHLNVMSYYNPVTTSAGKAVVAKWRSLASLWERATKTEERLGAYSTIIIVRDDDYWIAPFVVDPADFIADPTLVRVIPCLESHGINDKAVFLGRQAAQVLLNAYHDWSGPIADELVGSRNAEEFWYKKAVASGLTLEPSPMPMAVSSFTDSGLPCFRKQTFNLSAHGGYEKCYGEVKSSNSLTRFFHEFNCEDLNPEYYNVLPTDKVQELHQILAMMADQKMEATARQATASIAWEVPTAGQIILTLIDSSQAELALNMLSSLAEAGETSSVLVVGTQPGACQALTIMRLEGQQIHSHECVEVPHIRRSGDLEAPFSSIDVQIFKHAILTTVMISGFARGVLFAEPDVVFVKAPMQHFVNDYPAAHIVFSSNNAVQANAPSCRDVSPKYRVNGSDAVNQMWLMPTSRQMRLSAPVRFELDNGLFFVRDAPGVSDTLMRSWMLMADKEKGADRTQRWALTKAVEDAEWVTVGQGDCRKFVNGNVFWGHNTVVDPSMVVSIHASWVQASSKKSCLQSAGLWGSSFSEWPKAAQRLKERVELGGTNNTQIMSCTAASGEDAERERQLHDKRQQVIEVVAAATKRAKEDVKKALDEEDSARAAAAEARKKAMASVEELPPWWSASKA